MREAILILCTILTTISTSLLFIMTFLLFKATQKLSFSEFIKIIEVVGKDLITDTMIRSVGKIDQHLREVLIVSARTSLVSKMFPREFDMFGKTVSSTLDSLREKNE